MKMYRTPKEIQDYLKENNRKREKYFKSIDQFLSEYLGETIEIIKIDPADCWFIPKSCSMDHDFLKRERRRGKTGYRPLAKTEKGKAMRQEFFKFEKELEKPLIGFSHTEKLTGSWMAGCTLQLVEGEYILTKYEGWEPEKIGYTPVEIKDKPTT